MKSKFLTNRNGIYAKVAITFVILLLLASIDFFQKYGWTEATGQTLSLDVILITYLGYGIFAVFNVLIYLVHSKTVFNGAQPIRFFLLHGFFAIVFSLFHNLLFSGVYYLSNPIWQDYSFFLLYKDVLLNYFNAGLIFYVSALVFSEAYNHIVIGRKSTVNTEEQTLAIKEQGKTHLLKLEDIKYFLSADNYVKVITHNKSIMTRESMANLEKKLDPELFLRVHRSALVNKNFISEINRTPTGEINLVMSDSAVLPMSRRRKEVKSLLALEYLN